MPRFYRHSVWIDVFGILALLVLLLAPLGLLATEMMGGSAKLSGGASNRSVAGGTAPPPPSPRGPIAGRRQPAARHSSSLFGEAKRPSGAGAAPAAPFSEGWRKRATPSLTGPSGEGASAPTGGGSVGRATTEPFGPAIASRRSSGNGRIGSAPSGGRNTGSGWRAEARQFAGRARALANQLGQGSRGGSGKGAEVSSPKEGPVAASGSRTSAGASGPGSPGDPSRRGDPGDPQNAPIGDHLHWLAVLGVLWGAWRIWRGG